MPNIIKAVFTGGSVGAIKGNAFIGGTPLQTNKNIGTVPAGVNTNYTWNSIPYLSSLPIQICGFNRLMACTSNDCRDKPQLKCYFNPVFGNIGTNGPSYQNDVSSFFIRWAGYTPSFIIQRSTDGSSFTDIATQEAVGSGNNGYSYIDAKPRFRVAGGLYYRIKSIDKEGVISFSNVSLLTTNHLTLTTISVFPNPVSNSLTIKGSHISSVKVIDNLGKVVKTVSYHDETNPILSVGGLAKGVYHLRIETIDGNVSAVGFVKE